jgi:hypothetical protein
LKTARTICALALAAALVAVPSTALAAQGGNGKGKGKAKSCAKKLNRGFQVSGTFVSMDAGTLTLTVTAANSHARNSGELADQNDSRKGVQVVGATYTVPVSADVLKLGDDGTLVPAAGDRVKVKGRIAVTKKRCAAQDAATADDRYAAPVVSRVRVSHAEPATETETETETPTA